MDTLREVVTGRRTRGDNGGDHSPGPRTLQRRPGRGQIAPLPVGLCQPMDPIAHTLTGAALAASGLRRATPLATAALLIGANLPDIDAVTLLADPYLSLAHRRGWSHGILALALLPPLLAAALLCWDHLVRRRLRPAAPAARWWPLVLVSAIAVVSHPVLDWLNNYGMRWLMPFDGRWFYGDALFI